MSLNVCLGVSLILSFSIPPCQSCSSVHRTNVSISLYSTINSKFRPDLWFYDSVYFWIRITWYQYFRLYKADSNHRKIQKTYSLTEKIFCNITNKVCVLCTDYKHIVILLRRLVLCTYKQIFTKGVYFCEQITYKHIKSKVLKL